MPVCPARLPVCLPCQATCLSALPVCLFCLFCQSTCLSALPGYLSVCSVSLPVCATVSVEQPIPVSRPCFSCLSASLSLSSCLSTLVTLVYTPSASVPLSVSLSLTLTHPLSLFSPLHSLPQVLFRVTLLHNPAKIRTIVHTPVNSPVYVFVCVCERVCAIKHCVLGTGQYVGTHRGPYQIPSAARPRGRRSCWESRPDTARLRQTGVETVVEPSVVNIGCC